MISPIQKSLLTTAAQCPDLAIRWPATLRGGARNRIIAALTGAGLAENQAGTLVVTNAGMRAVGIEPAHKSEPAHQKEQPPRRVRANSKQAQLIAMLRSPEGATIAEIAASLGWQPHTVRGAMAGTLKKKLGLEVTSAKEEGRGRVYRVG